MKISNEQSNEKTNEILEAMKNPKTYDEKISDIRMIQTHISWVFLTGKFAYKIKKPVDFGFLDFSSLEKRKRMCFRELEINRKFSPEIYLGVLPLARYKDRLKIGADGEVIEYVIKMKELPQENIMSNLLENNKITTDILVKIVETLLKFYEKTDTYRLPNSVGSLSTVKYNWNENFRQTENFIGKTIDQKRFDEIKAKVFDFMEKNKSIFDKRLIEGKIKWCHGDLHSGNIFVVEDKVYIFDAIEFNERFACSDVASDLAFLAMDLDFRHKTFLSDFFIKTYIKKSGDEEIAKLLDFYKCYRAYVRGKVNSFKLNDPHLLDFEKEEAKNTAILYFQLASEYARHF
ncbi:MAG: phosphotransferase [Candidatus Aenigmatarchaeota archaeon]